MKRSLVLLAVLCALAVVPAVSSAARPPGDSDDPRAPRAFTPRSATSVSAVASWNKSACTSDSGDTCTCGAGKLCVAGADGCACIRPQQ
jgi:hypothetical protein